MSTDPACIRGRFWTPDGFVDGVCHHDERVLALDADGGDKTQPLFLPAPVDLHVHGGGGHDCMSGRVSIEGMLRAHARHGTGALLATSVTAPFSELSTFLDNVQQVMRDDVAEACTLLGAHLEGPFINPDKLGAQPPHAAPLNLDQLESWLDTGVVRLMTYAPEIDPHGDLPPLCRRYGVRLQLGHTLCSWSQAQQALLQGCGVTHLFNAMSGFSHRASGAAAAALAYAEYAEIITDGLHVERPAFDAARRAIPGLYSVTDATAAAGMPDGEYRLGSLTVQKCGESVLLPDGTLAGSCLTQRRSLGLLRDWGLDWHAIGAMCSAIPARWLGDDSVGRIAPGARAHWLEIADDQPVALWLAGRRQAFA